MTVAPREWIFLQAFFRRAVRNGEHRSRGCAVGEHGGVWRCAQGAVDDYAKGVRARDVADRQTRIIFADRSGADDDGVVRGAHLVGEAQGVRAADPLRFPRPGRHAPVERLRVAHGNGRPGRRLFAGRRILFLSYHDAPFVGPPASFMSDSPLEDQGRNMVLVSDLGRGRVRVEILLQPPFRLIPGILIRMEWIGKESMSEDRILLEDMVFQGRHGTLQAERELGQPFIVSIELRLDLRASGNL